MVLNNNIYGEAGEKKGKKHEIHLSSISAWKLEKESELENLGGILP